MSKENVEIVRRLAEAFPDVEKMLPYVDGDAELHSAIVGGAEGNVYRGHDGYRKWVADSFESFEELTNVFTDFHDLGDRVLTLGRVKARGRGSEVELDSPMGWVITVRNGKAVKSEGFLSRSAALEAAGLSERDIPVDRS